MLSQNRGAVGRRELGMWRFGGGGVGSSISTVTGNRSLFRVSVKI